MRDKQQSRWGYDKVWCLSLRHFSNDSYDKGFDTSFKSWDPQGAQNNHAGCSPLNGTYVLSLLLQELLWKRGQKQSKSQTLQGNYLPLSTSNISRTFSQMSFTGSSLTIKFPFLFFFTNTLFVPRKYLSTNKYLL